MIQDHIQTQSTHQHTTNNLQKENERIYALASKFEISLEQQYEKNSLLEEAIKNCKAEQEDVNIKYAYNQNRVLLLEKEVTIAKENENNALQNLQEMQSSGIAILRNQIQQQTQTIVELKRENQTYHKTVREKESFLTELQQRYDSLQLQIEKRDQELGSATLNWKQEFAEKENQLNDIREKSIQIADLKAKIQDCEYIQLTLRDQIEKQSQDMQVIKMESDRISLLNREYIAQTQQIEIQNIKYQELENVVSQLLANETDIQQFQETLANEKTQNTILRDNNKELKSDNQKLKFDCDSFSQKLNDAERNSRTQEQQNKIVVSHLEHQLVEQGREAAAIKIEKDQVSKELENSLLEKQKYFTKNSELQIQVEKLHKTIEQQKIEMAQSSQNMINKIKTLESENKQLIISKNRSEDATTPSITESNLDLKKKLTMERESLKSELSLLKETLDQNNLKYSLELQQVSVEKQQVQEKLGNIRHILDEEIIGGLGDDTELVDELRQLLIGQKNDRQSLIAKVQETEEKRKKEILGYQTDLDKLQKQIDNITDLQSSKNTTNLEESQLEDEHSEQVVMNIQNETIKKLTAQIAQRDQSIEDLINKNNLYVKELEQLHQYMDKLSNEIKSQKVSDAEEKEFMAVKQELIAVKQELEQARNDFLALSLQMDSTKQSVADKDIILEQLTQNSAIREQYTDQLLEELQKTKETLKVPLDKTADKSNVNSLEQERADKQLSDKIEILKTQLKENKENMNNLQNQLDYAVKKEQKTQQLISENEQQMNAFKNQLDQKDKEIETLRNLMQLLEGSNQQIAPICPLIISPIDSDKEKLFITKGLYEEANRNYNKELTKLKLDLKNKEEEAEQFKLQLSSLQEELTVIMSQIEASENSKMAEFSLQLQQRDSDIHSKNKQVEAAKENMDIFKANLANAHGIINQLEKKTQTLYDEIELLKQQNANLQQQLLPLYSNSAKNHSSKNSADSELEMYKEELEELKGICDEKDKQYKQSLINIQQIEMKLQLSLQREEELNQKMESMQWQLTEEFQEETTEEQQKSQ